ncbi:ATP-dependent exoDNAse (exonuclease V) beta subunit [Flavobacterium sp. 28A]|uniref:UvrD-helicase domain-containing protein n=1 Tax=Flavobacterium sp. 28A TaxID=2735895 RepID=UPI00156DA253|nr:UvrD-helicase domain-containing protein [Flavobacterium sp. 28A]NRT16975.1 ATP-dependent exoDNAse (exonuclease V) beta subunit [Flavobacterium sp. 28A]
MRNITFIYAGAGSGKTHTLTEKLLKWVQAHPGQANQVLFTTFTKKAANEIKERAQTRLLEHQMFDEAQQLNEAFIGTIDSVGYQFVKKYWYILGLSPEIQEISDNQKDSFFASSIALVPTEQELLKINSLCSEFNFTTGLFSSFNPNQWQTDVKSLVDKCLINQIDLANDPRSLNQSISQAKSIFRGTISSTEIQSIFEHNSTVLAENPVSNQNYAKAVELQLELSRFIKKELTVSDLQSIDRYFKTIVAAFGAAKYLSSREQLLEFDFSKAFVLQVKYIEYIQLIFDLTARSIQKYQGYKQDSGYVDFTDMEVHFLELLNNEQVKKEIQHTVQLVMVDEFQDCNPIQLSIFIQLSNLVGQSYWVGDPKQAIYGFRGSDPVLIDEIMKKFSKQNNDNLKVEMLKMSWRSSPELVGFTNNVFSQSLSQQLSEIYIEDRNQLLGKENSELFAAWKEQVSIHPMTGVETISLFPARNQSQDIQGANSLQFWNFLENAAKGNFKSASNDKYNNQLSCQIKNLLEQEIFIFDKSISNHRRLRGSDICVLFGTNINVQGLSKSLLEQGLKVNAATEGLLETIEYRFFKNSISLLMEPSSSLANAEMAILTGFTGTTEELFQNRFDFLLSKETEIESDFKTYWLKDTSFNEKIVQFKEHIKGFSVFYAINFIINEFNYFQELTNFGNHQLRRANLLRFITIAEEYEDSCLKSNLGSSLLGFIDFIEKNSAYNQQALTTDEDAIQLMTYHKSKGLEWSVVILGDLEKDYFADSEFFRKDFFKSRIKQSGDLNLTQPLCNRYIEFLFWPFGTAKSPNEELMEELKNTENYQMIFNATLNEKKRLLYVGITRSRDCLIFSSNTNKNLSWGERTFSNFNWESSFESKSLSNSASITLDLFDTNNAFQYQQFIFEEKRTTVPSFDEVLYFDKSIAVMQDKPFYISPSQSAGLAKSEILPIAEVHDRLKFKKAVPEVLGNVLHHMLYSRKKEAISSIISLLNQNNSLGIDETSFLENIGHFNQFIQANFDVVEEYPEIHLEQLGNDFCVRGEADLVLETAEGLILIDYKSFPGKKEEIFTFGSDFYAGKYSGQLDHYSEMLIQKFNKPVLKKLIYYVVQGILVEIQ